MKKKTPLWLDACSEESSAHADSQDTKVKARADLVLAVVIGHLHTKENQKEKENSEDHSRQKKNKKNLITKKDKERKARTKVSKEVRVRLVRKDTRPQEILRLNSKEKESQI